VAAGSAKGMREEEEDLVEVGLAANLVEGANWGVVGWEQAGLVVADWAAMAREAGLSAKEEVGSAVVGSAAMAREAEEEKLAAVGLAATALEGMG